MIEARTIHKRFEQGEITTHVLQGIDLSVSQGEFLGIMGRSGAGKSTLLYHLSGLDQPSEGSITVNGVDIVSMAESERSLFRLHTLGFVFQDYALIPELDARENVMLPLLMRGLDWRTAVQTAEGALESVGLTNRFNNLPSQLSGGEQQRVSIARAIAGKPKILFADEPTANLDSVSGQAVIDLLKTLHRDEGQTIIMVTHEEEYTDGCNRVVFIEDGRIVNEKHQGSAPKITRPRQEYVNPVWAALQKREAPPQP